MTVFRKVKRLLGYDDYEWLRAGFAEIDAEREADWKRGHDCWQIGQLINHLRKEADRDGSKLMADLPELEEHLTELRLLVERLRTLDMVA